jgi:peptide/nickel transport system substrate-binding protein
MSVFTQARGRKAAVAAAVAVALLAMAACSGGAQGGSGGGSAAASGSLTIAVDNGSPTLQDNFNPFSPNQRSGTPYMYEPLEYVNPLNGSYTPFLATGHTFVNNATLQFTIRPGVQWSDGQPLTAADVVYTFGLMKARPALDSAGAWQHLASVTAAAATVTFRFSAPDVPFAQQIAQTLIVPQHVWSKVSDPVTFTNAQPVVSGPYLLSSFTPNQYVLTKNPHCWQASQAPVGQLVFPALNGNQTSQLELASGSYDWSTVFVPNIQQSWVNKNPAADKYWFPPGGTITLYLNLARAPYSSQAFRQALSAGLDRSVIANKAEDGYVQPASQSGLLLPGLQSWLDPALPGQGVVSHQPQQAASLFAQAGYHMSGGKLAGPDGRQPAMTLIAPNGFTDWLQGAQVIQQELAQLGIAVSIQTPQYAAYYSDLQTGQFDAAIGAFGGTGSPYLDLSALLSSSLAAPVGQSAASNYERYKSPATDALLTSLQSTTDPARQKQDVYGLEQIMMTQVPVIALFYGATWGEYSTKAFTGWPDAANPYAPPAPYGSPPPDKSTPLMIITHLKQR